MKTSISTGGVRRLTQDEKAILAHPGSRAFALYFTIMCLGGFLYFLISESSAAFIIITGLAALVGGSLAIMGYKAAWGQEKVIEFDPAFETVNPEMQQHINNIQQKSHRKLMKKVHIMMPFLLLLFAAPVIGCIVLINALSALDKGGTPDIGKFILAGACIAYFILFIVVTLVLSAVSGSSKKHKPECPIETDGIIYSSVTSLQGTGGRMHREQIAVSESEDFLIAISEGISHNKGEKVRVRFDKNNPRRCTIINESSIDTKTAKPL